MTLSYKHDIKDGVSQVYWQGAIDEDWSPDISDLQDGLTDTAQFYFTNIETLNSVGIRLWTQFINEMSAHRKIEFYDCPSLIIRLLSISYNFCGKAQIKSFFVNLDCPRCECELAMRFESNHTLDSLLEEAGKVKCRSCDIPMELQEAPDTYEEFIKRITIAKQNRFADKAEGAS